MKYKHPFSDTFKKSKYGVEISVFGKIDKNVSFAYEETKRGHFEEFYSDKSTYMWFIIAGKGIFIIDDEKVEVSKNDLVVVPPKKRIHYFGKMRMILCVTPAFDEKNEHHVRDVSPDENPYK